MSTTVLITGGTRGVGKALVDLYLRHGFEVIATGASSTSVEQAKVNCPDVQWYCCDLTQRQEVSNLVQQIGTLPLKLVIHNAGVQQSRDFFQPKRELLSIEDETAINFTSVITLTKKLFSNIEQQSGTWVFVTSGLGIAPKQSSPVYCANKAGLRAFCKSLNGQVKRHASRVKVCEAILPLVDTDMTRGRGTGKISATQAAQEIYDGVNKAKPEIQVGKVRLLMRARALFPNFIENIMLKL
ncbi:putative oxidoreductase [Pseudoalteromonas citrea]|uniref:Oxidoreductase n=2 Tax=Pseudoalteromonas citrea TaxID=43655 RepID=A0AAD4AFH0_9GAMM|nr:SDR family NAD(P)-dependent oxidoreductase [Pseudoalteromonas citrea]KAF7764975.1 putative oxidoreductase [Pseudoalteromonas citrea]